MFTRGSVPKFGFWNMMPIPSRFRRVVILLGLPGLGAACRQGEPPLPDRTRSAYSIASVKVVLPPSAAQPLFIECDGTRTRVDSLWMPTEAVLQKLEVRLSDRITASSSAEQPNDASDLYSRQYVGFYRGDRALVLTNGIHRDYLKLIVAGDSIGTIAAARADSVSKMIQSSALTVCDGGELLFRAEYDVAADRILRFEFNGRG